ncbi:MAG: tryptophan-rich sensory protein [Kocuria sp.]|nr:tryptophan-rich sensory protein [Kocuria sp.]
MRTDLARRLFVTAAEIFCVVGTLVGTGVIGTRVAESSGGALSADATLIAPLGTAFSIWSVIYLGLFAYTIWQWLPRVATTARERRIGWLAGITMILNAVWLLVTQVGWIWVSVLVILALAVTLGILVKRLRENPGTKPLGKLIVDGTFGLYLGWVTAATCANIAAAGSATGWGSGRSTDEWIAVTVMAVAVVLSAVYVAVLGPRFAVAAGIAWALVWISVGRLTDEPASQLVGIAAAVLSAAVLVIWAVGRARLSRSPRDQRSVEREPAYS